MFRTRLLILTAGAAVLALAPAPGASAAAPRATVSLSGWKLTLPVDSSGCQCGTASTINPAAVESPWLTRDASGSLTFWAPTKGATTPNSKHPRTELVSLSGFTAGSGTHALAATVYMQRLPSAGDIIIGQIHGGGSYDSTAYVMVHYRNSSVVVVTRQSPSTGTVTESTVLSGIPMDASFSYSVTQSGSSMTITAAYGSRHGTVTEAVPSAFKGVDVRFQAGDYQQTDANSSSTDGGRLTFTALTQD